MMSIIKDKYFRLYIWNTEAGQIQEHTMIMLPSTSSLQLPRMTVKQRLKYWKKIVSVVTKRINSFKHFNCHRISMKVKRIIWKNCVCGCIMSRSFLSEPMETSLNYRLMINWMNKLKFLLLLLESLLWRQELGWFQCWVAMFGGRAGLSQSCLVSASSGVHCIAWSWHWPHSITQPSSDSWWQFYSTFLQRNCWI